MLNIKEIQLGPLIITVYCRTLIKELSRNEYDQESNQQFNEALRHLGHLVDFCEQDVHTFPNNVSDIMHLSVLCRSFCWLYSNGTIVGPYR